MLHVVSIATATVVGILQFIGLPAPSTPLELQSTDQHRTPTQAASAFAIVESRLFVESGGPIGPGTPERRFTIQITLSLPTGEYDSVAVRYLDGPQECEIQRLTFLQGRSPVARIRTSNECFVRSQNKHLQVFALADRTVVVGPTMLRVPKAVVDGMR
jgi:hypothetical protein